LLTVFTPFRFRDLLPVQKTKSRQTMVSAGKKQISIADLCKSSVCTSEMHKNPSHPHTWAWLQKSAMDTTLINYHGAG